MGQQERLTSGLMFCAATIRFIWVNDLAGIVEYYSCPDKVGRMGDMQTLKLPEEQLSGLSHEACVVQKAG